MHWDARELFKILSFYNTFIERSDVKKLNNVELLKELTFYDDVKKLNNVELLKELTFYDELSIVKNKTTFSGYAQSYKIEIFDKTDVVVQLKAGEIVAKKLFKDLLIELKGFKYQITLAVLLSKVKNNGEIEYSPVYFNSLTKTVINLDYKLDQSFQEIIHRLDNWISNRSSWVVEEIYSQYLNISCYLPLSGSTYMKLPVELQYPMKGLINIQNDDNK